MIRRTTIRSCIAADCPRPWFEFTGIVVTPLGITFTVARCTGPAASTECKTVTPAKERALEKAHTLAFDPTALTEPHVLALTLEGVMEFVPVSKQRQVYYAHLAFVDPVSGDAEVLIFEDDGESTRDVPVELPTGAVH